MFCHIFHNDIFFICFFHVRMAVKIEMAPSQSEWRVYPAVTRHSPALVRSSLTCRWLAHSHFSSLKHRFFVHVFMIYLHYLNYTLTIRSVIHHFLHPIASHTTSATSFT